MTNASILSRTQSERRIIRLQWVTLGWMVVECSVALFTAGWVRSVSLFAFGSDSFVELISAAAVLLQFHARFRLSQTQVAKFCGALLYVLASVVICISAAGLILHAHPDTSRLGIAVTVGALLLMPMLARAKRIEANKTGNKALRADAVQSATCAYLAALTLASLVVRSLVGIGWLDQVAALATVPILIVEARRARAGVVCGCC